MVGKGEETDSDRRRFSAGALLHPIWLIALVTLVLNDHFLKEAHLLPGWVTGKLSDFAGLIVAPMLLVTVLRVRSRGAIVLAHIAVGTVFSAIQLFPGAADLWTDSLALLGQPFYVWPDPTDLLALPMLFISFRYLGERRNAQVRLRGRRVLAGAVMIAGLLACMGSSPKWIRHPATDRPAFEADVYLHNATGVHLIIDQSLHAPEALDCAAAALDPTGYFTRSEWVDGWGEPSWSNELGWEIPPDMGIPAFEREAWEDAHAVEPCYAVRVTGESTPPVIFFWQAGDVPRHTIVHGDQTQAGAVILELAPLGSAYEYRFAPVDPSTPTIVELPRTP